MSLALHVLIVLLLGFIIYRQQTGTVEAPAPVVTYASTTVLLCDADGAVRHEQTRHEAVVPARIAYGGVVYQRYATGADGAVEYRSA